MGWEEGALFGSGQKLPVPGTAGPLSFTLSIQVTGTTSKGSEKPDRREDLLGQLSNFWGGVGSALSSLESGACSGGGRQVVWCRLEDSGDLSFVSLKNSSARGVEPAPSLPQPPAFCTPHFREGSGTGGWGGAGQAPCPSLLRSHFLLFHPAQTLLPLLPLSLTFLGSKVSSDFFPSC